MASKNGRAPPAPRVESGAGDAGIDLKKLQLTDHKRTATFQVFASQCFYGDEEQQLASPHVTFTHFEDSKNPSWSGSVINFKLRRRKDNRVININLQHSCVREMSFSSDVHMGAVMILNIPPVTSLGLQYNLQMGVQYRKITERLPANLDGLYCHLTFILKHWPGHPDMYMSLGLEGPKDLKDYKTFLEHAKECEKLRDAMDREKGLAKRALLARRSHPNRSYFTTMSKTELEDILDFIDLVPQKDREGNVVYGPGEVDAGDEGVGSSNEAVVPESRRVFSNAGSVPVSSPHSVVVRPPGIAKSVSPTKPLVQKAPGGQKPGVALRIVQPPDGQKQIRGLMNAARPAGVVVPGPRKGISPSVASASVAMAPSTSQVEKSQAPVKIVTKSKTEVRMKKGPEFVAIDDDISQDGTASTSATSSGSQTPAVSTPEPQPVAVPTADLTEDSTLLDYPRNAQGNEAIHIRVKDMQRTAMVELLNDSIIEFGIKFVFHDLHGEELRSATHVFSTFFFSSFAANPNGDKQGNIFLPANTDRRKKHLKDTYAKVRRWTRKIDIFKKKYIVIPVNNDMHWYLIVIVNPGKALRNKDDPMEDPALMDPEDLCQLILFDSLPDPEEPKRACLLQIMRDYLGFEFEEKKKKSEPNLFFSSQHMVQVRLRGLPVQKNLVDCGVYLIAYLEFYMHKPPKVPQNRIVKVAEWCYYCRLGFIEFYRDKIIARIKKLCGSQMWSKFEKFEREARKKDPQTARVTVYSESDLVNLGRRPRRHECYSCPDVVKPEPIRTRAASLPPPGVLVPSVDRVKYKYD